MGAAPAPTGSGIVGGLLAGHPEAVSLLSEATHHQGLAEHSAAEAARRLTGVQAARLAHEDLRHRLDPRHRRPLDFVTGLAVLAVIAAGVAVICAAELAGVAPAPVVAPAAPAVAAVWLTGAWLAVLAIRDGRHRMLGVLATAGAAASLLLAALRMAVAPPRGPAWPAAGASVLGNVLIAVLAGGAAALIARLEPASVFRSRRAWLRARAGHRAAARLAQADAEAAAVARDAWLGLVRSHGAALAGGQGERLVQDSVTFAAALAEAGRHPPGLPAAAPAAAGFAPAGPEAAGRGGPP